MGLLLSLGLLAGLEVGCGRQELRDAHSSRGVSPLRSQSRLPDNCANFLLGSSLAVAAVELIFLFLLGSEKGMCPVLPVVEELGCLATHSNNI
ncbi:hypothetical protein P7K49_014503 [Saguinus oedipus]|uniref:Uncharacterized protein n=1 Tax=Saguinus oedipus TaxID=9490 RepID=A0ABQ9VIY7_SAGOE|nr:hypothetical protein P7K49_014503 [Saguinus oedipus]